SSEKAFSFVWNFRTRRLFSSYSRTGVFQCACSAERRWQHQHVQPRPLSRHQRPAMALWGGGERKRVLERGMGRGKTPEKSRLDFRYFRSKYLAPNRIGARRSFQPSRESQIVCRNRT